MISQIEIITIPLIQSLLLRILLRSSFAEASKDTVKLRRT
jgi:hypothetical protein